MGMLDARGFTLLEMLLVVAIILVIGVMSTVAYSRTIVTHGVVDATDMITSVLRKAQGYSMSGKASSTSGWGVYYTTSTLVLYQGSSYATANHALDESYTVPPSVTVSGLSDINFARVTGLPTSTALISVYGSGASRSIIVNAQGIVSR